MSRTKRLKFNAVLYKKDDVWFAQALEKDFLGSGKDLPQALFSLMSTILNSLCIAEELGDPELESVRQAPPEFWKLWELAEGTVREEVREKVPQKIKAERRDRPVPAWMANTLEQPRIYL